MAAMLARLRPNAAPWTLNEIDKMGFGPARQWKMWDCFVHISTETCLSHHIQDRSGENVFCANRDERRSSLISSMCEAWSELLFLFAITTKPLKIWFGPSWSAHLVSARLISLYNNDNNICISIWSPGCQAASFYNAPLKSQNDEIFHVGDSSQTAGAAFISGFSVCDSPEAV